MYENVKPEVQGPYSLGQSHWPGLAKVQEEAAELLEVLAKIVANGGKVRRFQAIARDESGELISTDEPKWVLERRGTVVEVSSIQHYDGRNLLLELLNEAADLRAALAFFLTENREILNASLPNSKKALMYVLKRRLKKEEQFKAWHKRHLSARAIEDVELPLEEESDELNNMVERDTRPFVHGNGEPCHGCQMCLADAADLHDAAMAMMVDSGIDVERRAEEQKSFGVGIGDELHSTNVPGVFARNMKITPLPESEREKFVAGQYTAEELQELNERVVNRAYAVEEEVEDKVHGKYQPFRATVWDWKFAQVGLGMDFSGDGSPVVTGPSWVAEAALPPTLQELRDTKPEQLPKAVFEAIERAKRFSVCPTCGRTVAGICGNAWHLVSGR